jgi:hypothetical protein
LAAYIVSNPIHFALKPLLKDKIAIVPLLIFMAAVRKEKAYEKYAWLIPFVMGLFFLISMAATIISPRILTGAENAVETLTGTKFSQIAASSLGIANCIYYLITILAIFSAGLGAFIMVVSATAYRKGEVWAWYLIWVVPMLFLLDFANDYRVLGYVDVGSIVIIAILVAGLLLPFRKFFPIKQHSNAT